MSELTFGMRLTYDGKSAGAGLEETRAKLDGLTNSSTKLAAQNRMLGQTYKEHGKEVQDTERGVKQLLDRYDPLGAKLRQLQDDFKKLNAAAAGGKIAAGDDARTDLAYANIQKQMTAASAATDVHTVSTNRLALSSKQLAQANRQLPMQFTDIWVSLAAGQSPMMVMLQQGTQIKDSFGGIGPALRAMGGYMRGLVNPVTLVTGALIAGGVAWYNWGESAQEAMDKASARLKEAEKDAKAAAGGRQRTTAEQIKALEGKRDGVTGQLEAAQKRLAGVNYKTDALLAQAIGQEVSARKQELFDYEKQIADLKKRQAEEESKPGKKKEKQDTAFLDALQRESDIYGMTAGQIKIYEAAKRGITGVQMEQVIALAEEKDAQDAAAVAAKENAKAIEEANRILANLDPIHKATAEWTKLVDLHARGLLTEEEMATKYTSAMDGIVKQTDKAAAGMSDIWKNYRDSTQRVLGDQMFDAMMGKFSSLEDAFKQMIFRIAANAAAANLTEKLFGSGKGGDSGVLGSIAKAFGFANGGAFGSGGMVPFANGGAFGDGMVLNGPKPFLFGNGGSFNMGVAGEAGPEGALPLKRMSNGKLGVYADGGGSGGSQIVINDHTTINVDARSDRAQALQEISQLIDNKQAQMIEILRRQKAIA